MLALIAGANKQETTKVFTKTRSAACSAACSARPRPFENQLTAYERAGNVLSEREETSGDSVGPREVRM